MVQALDLVNAKGGLTIMLGVRERVSGNDLKCAAEMMECLSVLVDYSLPELPEHLCLRSCQFLNGKIIYKVTNQNTFRDSCKVCFPRPEMVPK